MSAPADPLARGRALARLLDTAITVPGTGVRLGADALLGLVPGLGDVAGALLGGYLVLLAQRLGAPRSVILRMLGNVALDTLGGSVPIFGDLFDVAFKSNIRNVALLEHALERPTEARRASRLMVLGAIVGLVLLGVAAVAIAVVAIRAVAGAMHPG